MNRLRHRLGGVRAKECARWSFGVLIIAAVTLSTALGGTRYLYCRAMDKVMTEATCACAQTHVDAQGQLSLGADNHCFEVRFLDRLVSFTVAGDLAVPSAPLVGILSFPSLAVAPTNALPTGANHPIRAGPFSPTAHRAQLMVFLT